MSQFCSKVTRPKFHATFRYEKGKSISESSKMVDGKERKTKFTIYDNGEELLEIREEGKLISRQVFLNIFGFCYLNFQINGFETVHFPAITWEPPS